MDILEKEFKNLTINKGTGAGGSNTNLYGKKFEDKTNNEENLLNNGFSKVFFDDENNKTNKKNKTKSNKSKFRNFYLIKTFEDKKIIFVKQSNLKKYVKEKYNIELFRFPDEAYIIEYNDDNYDIKILEKKEQHVDGSVETKLWSGPSLKREYELVLGDKFNVDYSFCINSFLQKKLLSEDKKYIILNKILNENNILVFFGDDNDYFNKINNWANHSINNL